MDIVSVYQAGMTAKKPGKTFQFLVKGLTSEDIALLKAASAAVGRSGSNFLRFLVREHGPRILQEKGVQLPSSAKPDEVKSEDDPTKPILAGTGGGDSDAKGPPEKST